MKKKVLFVCIHNSARSQLAEALMNEICGGDYEAESAGIEPGTLNPLAVAVLREKGVDISTKPTRSVFDLFKSGKLFNFVITVCDEASAERCPIFPGVANRLHWSFADPSKFEGSWEQRLAETRKVSAEIEAKVREFCAVHCHA